MPGKGKTPHGIPRTENGVSSSFSGFDEGIRWPKKVNVSERWCRDEWGKAFHVHNDRDERKKLKAWIGENPRLMAFEPMPELDLERRRFMHR